MTSCLSLRSERRPPPPPARAPPPPPARAPPPPGVGRAALGAGRALAMASRLAAPRALSCLTLCPRPTPSRALTPALAPPPAAGRFFAAPAAAFFVFFAAAVFFAPPAAAFFAPPAAAFFAAPCAGVCAGRAPCPPPGVR